MGVEGGFTKFSCYLCNWDDRNAALHNNWPHRFSCDIEAHNLKQATLVEPKKVLLAPLRIKLGLFKQFVKKLNPEDDVFEQIQELFPKLSQAKIKAGVFVSPHVKTSYEVQQFFLRSYLRLRGELGKTLFSWLKASSKIIGQINIQKL